MSASGATNSYVGMSLAQIFTPVDQRALVVISAVGLSTNLLIRVAVAADLQSELTQGSSVVRGVDSSLSVRRRDA